MARFLITFATVILFSGCCTVPAHVPFEAPERPVFENYTQALWDAIPEEARIKISNDDLAMKDYIKQVEIRTEIHNED